ncbi:MAG: FecR family protein [Chlorobi bacterium]|nr:FecR family protein [Chlorobiota bacterium]
MDKYSIYTNDPYFIKWIFRPDPLSEQYWENYIKSHPDEKYIITHLKKDLRYLKLKNEDITEEEKRLLIQSILKKKNKSARVTRFRQASTSLLRYAAIAIMFLIIGNVIMYLYLNKKFKQTDYTSLESNITIDKPTLILSDGTDIALDKASNIRYNTGNGIIVDNRAVSIPENDNKEIVLNQAIIPCGSRSKITLDDNTVVYLNAGSKLIYPSAFTDKKREVLLFGEAFFEVSKNKEKPFIVKTSSLTIEVLGTKFNVSSYQEDDIIQTILVEGEVSVKRNDVSLYKKSIILKPKQMLAYNKITKDIKTSYVDVEYFILWKDGILKFENEDLSRVIKKIERFYNISIRFKDPLQSGVKISGKLDLSENKYKVFEYLKTLTKMNIEEEEENHYVIN